MPARTTHGYAPVYRGLLEHREVMGFAGSAVYDTLLLMADPEDGSLVTNAGEIGDLFGKSAKTIRRILCELEEQGYISREFDLVNGRNSVIRIDKFKTASAAKNGRISRERQAAIERTADSISDMESVQEKAPISPSTQRKIEEAKRRLMGWSPVDNSP